MTKRAIYPTFYDEKNKIWSGIKRRALYHPDCNIGLVIFENLKNWPNHIVEIHQTNDRQVTCAEINQWATRLALFFRHENLTQNDVVGIIAKSSLYISALTAACFFQATPFHAVNANRDTNVVKAIYENTKPKIMFCDGADYERIKDLSKEWSPKIITLTGHVKDVTSIEDLLKPTAEEHIYQPAELDIDGDQTAAILCSSGSAGLPKSVALSHRYISLIKRFCNSTDLLVTTASLDWGTDIVVNLIQKYKVALLIIPPWQVTAIFSNTLTTEKSLSSLKVTFITGAWISLKLLQQAQNLMKKGIVIFCYGATETYSISAKIDHRFENSVGGLLPGIRVKICDEQGNNLPPNEIGLVHIDNGIKWQGYVNNAEDTALTLKNGWIELGDLGYFNNDNNLCLVDRKKDLLKYNSNQYWPNEIEHIILELPEVLYVCVVGIHDDRHGDSAGALVIKRSGAEISEKQIIDHVAKRVAVVYKHLHSGVQFVDKLPCNPNGKVIRSQAKQLFETCINK